MLFRSGEMKVGSFVPDREGQKFGDIHEVVGVKLMDAQHRGCRAARLSAPLIMANKKNGRNCGGCCSDTPLYTLNVCQPKTMPKNMAAPSQLL